MRTDHRSPFCVSNMKEVIDFFNNFAPITSNIDDGVHPGSTYLFSTEFMQRLFPMQDHPTIAVAGSIKEVLSDPTSYKDKNIIIIAGLSIPDHLGNNVSLQPDQILLKNDHNYPFKLCSINIMCGKEN